MKTQTISKHSNRNKLRALEFFACHAIIMATNNKHHKEFKCQILIFALIYIRIHVGLNPASIAGQVKSKVNKSLKNVSQSLSLCLI